MSVELMTETSPAQVIDKSQSLGQIGAMTTAAPSSSPSPAPAPAPSAVPGGLWRHGGFLRLWGGETASQFGSQLGGLAIPVLAVTILQASEFEIGALSAAGTAAFLVVGLPAGAWVDRMLKRRVMIWADGIRALAMALVPILWIAGALEMWHLMALAIVVGVATVFFDVSYQSYVPVLVARSQIADANAKLETTSQLARIGGPALAGGLLTVLAAPFLLAGTALTYLASFFVLTTIHDREVPAPRENRRSLWVEIKEGAAFVWNQPLLRSIVACTSVSNFFSTLALTMLPLLVLRDLDLGPAVLGIATAVGSIGGLLGAALSARLARWLGEGTIIPLAAIAGGIGTLLLAAMSLAPEFATGVFILGEFVLSFSVLVYNIAQVSFRQRICPTPLLGRMNASIRFVVWGVMPIAGLLSGLLALNIGAAAVLWIGAIGTLLAAGFVVFSPLLRLRTLPDTAAP